MKNRLYVVIEPDGTVLKWTVNDCRQDCLETFVAEKRWATGQEHWRYWYRLGFRLRGYVEGK